MRDETSRDPLGPERPGLVRGYIRRLRRRFRPPRRLYPTKSGMFVLTAPIILGLAAINASNNLLFMLLALTLALIVLSGLLSEANLWRLSVKSEVAGRARAGEAARVLVKIERPRSGRGASPRFGVRVSEVRPRGAPKAKQPLDVMIPVLDTEQSQVLGTRVFERRGVKEFKSCEISTRFPFALFSKVKDIDLGARIVVWPKRVEVPDALSDPRGVAADGRASKKKGLGLDVYGLRERNDWDPANRIHALRSMRLGRDVVIETEAMTRPIAWLGVCNAEGADPEAFERTLEIASATLERWDELGYAVGLETISEVCAPGVHSVAELIDRLALLAPEPAQIRPPSASAWLVPTGAGAVPETRTIRVLADGSLAGGEA